MPGLVGYISDDVRDDQLLERMIGAVVHEPWYKVDRYVNPPFHMARVHLGKFDSGPQPVFNEDGTLCIFMDGQVYGYDDEKKRLEGSHRFSSGSDAEFCLHLYEDLGMESFRRLNGNFALAICDLKEKKAILVNDRNTLRPVYYAQHNGGLLFAPQAKPILQDTTFKKELDVEGIAMNLAFGEFWGDKTLFSGIRYLEPASALTFGRGQLARTQYWDLNYQPDSSIGEGAAVEQLIAAVKRAVAIRMKDNVRYGISLSGGLDSRAVLAAVEPDRRKGMPTFGYGPLHCGEVKIAEQVARKCGTSHRSVEITPQLIIESAERAVWLTEGRMSIWLSYMVPAYKAIAGDIDVVFDGLGFGQTLGGAFLRKSRVAGMSKDEMYADYQKDRTVFRDAELLRVFVPRYHGIAREAPANAFGGVYSKMSSRDPRLAFDEFYWHSRLAYIATMHVYGRDLVEISCPTVDNDLNTLAYSLPPEKRLGHYIYREFLKKLSPELARIPYNKTMVPASGPFLLWRAGKAYRFGKEAIKQRLYTASKGKIYIPNSYKYIDDVGWLRASGEWRKYIRDLLLVPGAASREYFQQDYVQSLISEHQDGTSDNADKILRLVTFELFLRQFMT
jgi:asparagine synthase (glutamine-hydrolysing)